jgi:uncharacterized membrane protein
MKRFLFFIVALFFLFSPHPVSADEGWTIDSFNSQIAIQQTGDVDIVETINVDFNTLSKHGIYREIPYVYESQGQKTYTEIMVSEIKQNGEQAIFNKSQNDGYIHLKIGNPDKTISGKNTYTIHYTARGVLKSFEDHDELYWNATGDQWPVPITKATATVILPSDGIIKTACYEGYAGSQGECSSQIKTPNTASFINNQLLGESQGMTIVAGYKKGLVPVLTVDQPKTMWEKFVSWPSQATLIFSLLFGIGTIFYLWYKGGRDYWFGDALFAGKENQGKAKPIGGHETVVVEFTPPGKLRPAELGVLMDERADTHDVVSTIIDLAGRGYLTISELKKAWLFGKIDYLLTKKQKETKELLPYEKLLLDKLFEKGTTENTVTVSSLKTTFYQSLQEVKQELYKEMVKKQLFPSDPEKVRSNYIAIAICLLVAGGVIGGYSLSGEVILTADIGLGILISGFILCIMSQFMPRRTAYGRDMFRRGKGYYRFINSSEKYRQQFFEKKNMFNEVLPYAIVFGLTAKFAKHMDEIGLKGTQPSWYIGTHPFTTTTFASSMDDFSKSMSSAIASTPQGSGLSGGGSSGGGFGGGGGGSW